MMYMDTKHSRKHFDLTQALKNVDEGRTREVDFFTLLHFEMVPKECR